MWVACSLQFDYFTAGSQSEKAAGGELSEGMVLESINGVSQAGLPYDDVRAGLGVRPIRLAFVALRL